jgi:hypothetical protein
MPAFKFKQRIFLAVLERGRKARGYGDTSPSVNENSPPRNEPETPAVKTRVCIR